MPSGQNYIYIAIKIAPAFIHGRGDTIEKAVLACHQQGGPKCRWWYHVWRVDGDPDATARPDGRVNFIEGAEAVCLWKASG